MAFGYELAMISMREHTDDLLQMYNRYQLNLLYGRRGVGKTTFLIQFSLRLSEEKKKVIFIGFDKKRDRVIERRLRKAIAHDSQYLRFTRFNSMRGIILYMGELASENNYEIIVLDDVLPIRFLIGKIWTKKLTQQVGIFLSLMIDLLNSGHIIWISVPEYPRYKLPRRWQLFIEYNNNFYRLSKKRRIRILSHVKVDNLPPIGARWELNKSNIKIIEKTLIHLLLTPSGFIPLSKNLK